MSHIAAIAVFVVVCVAWLLVQRASERVGIAPRQGGCGRCGGGDHDHDGAHEGAVEGGCARRACPNRPAAGTSLFAALLAAASLLGCVDRADPEPAATEAAPGAELIVASAQLMGTEWSIRAAAGPHADEAAATVAVDAAFAEIDRIEAVMSEWRPETPISLVNAGAGGPPVEAPEELIDIVRRALGYADASGGAFDPTWRGLGELWAVYRDDFRPPDAAAVEAARGRVDFRSVELGRSTIRLPRPGMALGLGGIAKGYAIDRAAQTLRAAGVEHFTVDGGGDVIVGGGRPDGTPWRVGVRAPRGGRTDLIGIVEVRDAAVATSGDYERARVIDGVRYHHIVDPRTGYPATGTWSVTVVAPTAEQADAMATALFVLGPSAGMALLERSPGVDALIVDDQGERHASPGFMSMFVESSE